MTDKAYNLKLWFYDLKDFERQAEKSRAHFLEYDINAGRLVSSYEYRTHANGGTAPDKVLINRIMRKQELYNRWQNDLTQYITETMKRYNLINEYPDSYGRAFMIEHYLLNKKLKDMSKKRGDDTPGEYTEKYIIKLINNALEYLAELENIPG